MSAPVCPECDARMELADGSRVGEIVECDDCRSELEIVSVSPALLTLAPEIEDDWGE